MNYPADSDVVLLLCEDARLEVGNKVTIIGWYVGGDIVIPKSEEDQVLLPSLALIFLIRSGDGEFQGTAKVIHPNGSAIIETQPLQIPIRKGASAAHLLRAVPFSAKIGKYTAEFRLNERTYHSGFTVTRSA